MIELRPLLMINVLLQAFSQTTWTPTSSSTSRIPARWENLDYPVKRGSRFRVAALICDALPSGAAAETQNVRHQEHQLSRWSIPRTEVSFSSSFEMIGIFDRQVRMEVFIRHSWAVQIRSLRVARPAGFSFLPGRKCINQGKEIPGGPRPSRTGSGHLCFIMVSRRLSFIRPASFSLEYNQSFTLSINRNHRGFRRVVSSRGLKLELLHRGWVADAPAGGWERLWDSRVTWMELRKSTALPGAGAPSFLTLFWDCLCLGPQRFPAEQQAHRDGGGEAGQTGDAERNQRDHRSEGDTSGAAPFKWIPAVFNGDETADLDPLFRWWTAESPQEGELKWRCVCGSLWADRTCRRAQSAGCWSVTRRYPRKAP